MHAAGGGHEAVVRLLLEWREHASRADSRGGVALRLAHAKGHTEVSRSLEEALARL